MKGTIILGFDGSPDAIAAAHWDGHEAGIRGAALRILHTYDYPYLERLEHQAQEVLAAEPNATAEAGRPPQTKHPR